LTRASSSDVGLMRRVEAKGDVALFTRSRWVFQFIENRLIPSLTLERKWLLKKAGPSRQGCGSTRSRSCEKIRIVVTLGGEIGGGSAGHLR